MERSEKQLWQRLGKAKTAKTRDRIRNELVVIYLPLCERLALKFCVSVPTQIEYGDVYSAACEGLINCVPRFDLSRGIAPATFLSYRITGAIKDYLRSTDDLTRSHRLRINRVETWEQTELGRPATRDEVEDHFGFTVDRPATLSMSTVVNDRETTLGETIPGDDRVGRIEDVTYLLKGLDRRERLVVLLYHVEHYTMKQVAETLGLSESRVSQMMGPLLDRMRMNATKAA